MVKVAIGAFQHETNTYAADVFGLTTRDLFGQVYGQRIINAFTTAKIPIGGFIAAAKELNYELVPTFYCNATPSGTIDGKDYEYLKDQLVSSIAKALPVDAVAIELHGAGVSEFHDDIESDIGKAIREIIGPDIPLICSLDLHGNIYDEMLQHWDAMVGYRLYPHEDQFETGYKVFHLLPQLLQMKNKNEKFAIKLKRLPMVLLTTSTDSPFPHFKVNQLCLQLENEHSNKLIDLRLMHGFPFTNITLPNPVVMCTCIPGEEKFAETISNQIASYVWKIKDEYLLKSFTPKEAIKEALNHYLNKNSDGPVIIHETNDNTGCGSPGDATYLLNAMLELDVGKKYGNNFATFGFFCDKDAVQEALNIGVGRSGTIHLGGKTGPMHGETIVTTAKVKGITDGRFTLEFFAPGLRINLGTSVRLEINGIDVIVTTRRNQTFDTEIFKLHGIDVLKYGIVALKSSIHFRAGFRKLKNGFEPLIVTCDEVGLTSNNMHSFNHDKANGFKNGLWPINEGAVFDVNDGNSSSL